MLLRATVALGKRDASNTKSDGENTEAVFFVASTVDGIIVASEHHICNCKSGSCLEVCTPPRAPPSQR